MRVELLTGDVANIRSFLETIVTDGGVKFYSIEGVVSHVSNLSGMSGYDYREDGSQGRLTVGLILGGTGYILHRTLHDAGETQERYDYFNNQGDLTFSSDKEVLKPVFVDFHEMDLNCPILNHLYNYLSVEYKNAAEGKSQTALVHSVETFLRILYKSKLVHLSIQDGANDPAVTNIYNKILAVEMDPVLTWEERQLVFDNYRKELRTILRTKIRAHRLNKSHFKSKLVSKECGNFLARFLARPVDNSRGLLYKYTIGKIIWFFQTVRNNLGYSIALAVYGPFTYYFITMPMNPHAMQAVGRVRSTYLGMKEEVSRVLNYSETSLAPKEAIAASTNKQIMAPAPVVTDTVSNTAAAPAATSTPSQDVLANIISPSHVTEPSESLVIQLGDGATEKVKPTLLNMLLTTDSTKINNATWFERMSQFKQMQIAYEENIEYASRMGRLEQLETQYNFPMQVEATWEELERYNNAIFKIREENPNLSAKMKQYLFNEINRTQQLELYLWDRMSRFILDQIYVMLDQDKEQKRNDYYVGRSFVFMEEMTDILSWRYKDFKKPEGFDKIKKLSEFYKNNRKEMGTVMKNLTANSDLFKQKNIYDTKEFRSYMKRQWEILYLQNSKAEEASNMGLNMYIWSVRNTVWILQSMFSAKRDELPMLVKRDSLGVQLTPAEMLTRSKISMLYETQFHNLTLEYVGIREEIMNRLGKDIESAQRMTVINNLKEFLSDREKLDNLGEIANKNTAGTKL